MTDTSLPSCYVPLMGGLGNQLFQIATAYAHCRRHGYCLSVSSTTIGGRPTYWERTLQRVRPFIGVVDPSARRWGEPHFHYAPIPADARNLFGYFQSGKYFSDLIGEIRELFSAPAEITETVNVKYDGLIKPNSVAIHVRRTDYLKENAINYHFVTTNSYFERAMNEARIRDPSAEFVVFSDDLEWCKRQSFFAGATFIDEPDECLALELMSRFRRYIISNSSFSWWATWLGAPAELVLAPNRWFGPRGSQDWEDIYEPQWIRVETQEKSDCYIQLAGGLCNQLFQVAALLQHCMRNKYTPKISGTCMFKPTYWDTWLHGASRYIGNSPTSTSIWRESAFHYVPIPSSAQILSGYFQSSKYFADIAPIIRRLFDIPTGQQNEIMRDYAPIMSDSVRAHAIVVHVRRGDYLTGPVNPTKHGFLTADYYRRAIAEARARKPVGDAAPLLVFSDDLACCRSQDFFEGALFIDEPYDVKALWIMSRYHNYVMSNSTFSWWAVWLGPTATCVIAPDRWFGHPGPYDFEDIYEPEWIKISP